MSKAQQEWPWAWIAGCRTRVQAQPICNPRSCSLLRRSKKWFNTSLKATFTPWSRKAEAEHTQLQLVIYIYNIYILYRLLCFLHLVASCCILLHMISADPAMDSCRRPCSVWRESALSLGLSRDCGNPLEDLARRILSLKFQAFFVSLWSSLIVFICPNWCQGFGKEGCRQVDDLHSQNMQMMKHPANFLCALYLIYFLPAKYGAWQYLHPTSKTDQHWAQDMHLHYLPSSDSARQRFADLEGERVVALVLYEQSMWRINKNQ